MYTNDPARSLFDLTIVGRVEPFADVRPDRVAFRGKPDDISPVIVRIAPRENHPFTIQEAAAMRGDHIGFTLARDAEDASYLLTIENRTRAPGKYTDRIDLRTDNALKPTITIRIHGYVLE